MGRKLGFRVVSVASGKGGVGKSSVAVNLALQLKALGLRVGILDADLDSPYLSEIIGARGKILLNADRTMVPVPCHGMPVMSFALYVPDEFAGATMTGEIHKQWIRDAVLQTDWGPIDILVCDLPAGSSAEEYVAVREVAGDAFLGLVVVALPNVIGGLQRVYNTAARHRMRILGVVENMAGGVFGSGPVGAFCREKGLRFFGSIPLDARVRQAHESGHPELPEDLMGPVRAAAAVALERRVDAR